MGQVAFSMQPSLAFTYLALKHRMIVQDPTPPEGLTRLFITSQRAAFACSDVPFDASRGSDAVKHERWACFRRSAQLMNSRGGEKLRSNWSPIRELANT